MPRMKCPRCATIVDVAPGAAPVCPNCGFGAGNAPQASSAMPPPPPPPPPPAAAPAPATTGWAAPAPQAAFSPPAAAPMQRPGWVMFAAVMQFLGAAGGILGGLVLLVGGSFFAAIFEEEIGEFGDLLAGFLMVLGVFLIALGVLALFVGIGLLKGRSWARWTAVVLAALNILLGILSALTGDPSQVLGLLLSGLVIFALVNKQSKAWFEAMAHQPH